MILPHVASAADKPVTVSLSKKRKSEQKCHPPCDISDFYDVADLTKEPILFSPVKEVKGTGESSPPPKVRTRKLATT